MAAANQLAERQASVVFPLEEVEYHRSAHAETRAKRFGRRFLKARKGVGVPMCVSTLRRLPHLELAHLLRIAACLRAELLVFNRMLGRLCNDAPERIEASAPCAPRDLLEVANGQHLGFLAVVLAELGEEHRSDGHVHTDPQRVGAADDSKLAFLGKALHQAPVAWEHTGVVHANPMVQELLELFAKRRVETRAAEVRLDGTLLVLRQEVDAHEALGLLGRGPLREVHDVNRALALFEQLDHRVLQVLFAVSKVERHGAIGALHQGGGDAGELGDRLFELWRLAERCTHHEEACVG